MIDSLCCTTLEVIVDYKINIINVILESKNGFPISLE